jgi:hypothetical protein
MLPKFDGKLLGNIAADVLIVGIKTLIAGQNPYPSLIWSYSLFHKYLFSLKIKISCDQKILIFCYLDSQKVLERVL